MLDTSLLWSSRQRDFLLSLATSPRTTTGGWWWRRQARPSTSRYVKAPAMSATASSERIFRPTIRCATAAAAGHRGRHRTPPDRRPPPGRRRTRRLQRRLPARAHHPRICHHRPRQPGHHGSLHPRCAGRQHQPSNAVRGNDAGTRVEHRLPMRANGGRRRASGSRRMGPLGEWES